MKGLFGLRPCRPAGPLVVLGLTAFLGVVVGQTSQRRGGAGGATARPATQTTGVSRGYGRDANGVAGSSSPSFSTVSSGVTGLQCDFEEPCAWTWSGGFVLANAANASRTGGGALEGAAPATDSSRNATGEFSFLVFCACVVWEELTPCVLVCFVLS